VLAEVDGIGVDLIVAGGDARDPGLPTASATSGSHYSPRSRST
jgi:hypothetical protein